MPTTQDTEASARPVADGDEIDLRAYWRILMRRRWVIGAVFAAVVLVTLLFTLRQTKVYSATATLIIEVSAPKVLNQQEVQDVVETGSGGYLMSKEYTETQYKVIQSRAVAQRVVEKLQLAKDLRFLGLDHLKDTGKIEHALSKADPISELQERVKVIPVKDSRIARIQVDDRDPKWAATLANAVAEAYITENLSVKTNTTQGASDWLEQQLGELETKLDQSGKALFDFKKSHDIVATTWEDRQGMVTQQLVAINDALTKARVQRAQLEARSEQIVALGDALEKGEPAGEAFAIVANSRTVQELKVKLAEASVECAGMRDVYMKDYPKLQGCEARLSAARGGLRHEVRTILNAARAEYAEVVQTERKLVALLSGTKADAFGINQYERDYLELKRAHDNNQRLYEAVLKRLKDASVTGMLQLSNVRILDRAEPPERPTSPRPMRNLALAMLLGLVSGVGLAFLLEMLDTTITTREQVEERLGLAFLGIIPSIDQTREDKERDLFVHANPRSAAAECLRSIRTNLLFMSPEKALKTIVVTSASPGDGKTTTATALAEVMAEGGSRVLIVDADMRRPQLHAVFELPNDTGLSSLIVGDGKLDQAIRSSSVPNLSVLTCGPIPPNPAELLHTEGFTRLLQAMAQRYDRVIIDSPPAGVVADAVVISTQVDGTLMVLKAGQTSRDAAERAVRSIVDVKGKIFGAVLNDLDLTDQRYGQYDQYYRYGYYDAVADNSSNAGAA
ncbi:MAG: polysaccharide biosynthesis tyrosine autokinase [Anaeromyxobacteraceae bacterium]